MKYQIALLAAALFMLVFSSCEKGTLDPSTGTGSTSAASYDGALNRNSDALVTMDQETPDGEGEVSPCIILPELPGWHSKYFVIERATVRDDILSLVVSYSGGCKPHKFQMVSTTFQESEPVRVMAKIYHTGKDDPCDEWVTEVRSFDLTALKELHNKLYETSCGEIIITLADGVQDDLAITYHFCAESVESVSR